MSEWYPIETARKGGPPILTYGCLHDDGGVDMGEVPSIRISMWVAGYGWFNNDVGSHEPTHWMPLPQPPKESR
jgi:hypothetical protein